MAKQSKPRQRTKRKGSWKEQHNSLRRKGCKSREHKVNTEEREHGIKSKRRIKETLKQ